jgi:hypothetical protein
MSVTTITPRDGRHAMSAGPSKGAQFLASCVGQDALTIPDLLEVGDVKDARIAQLEAVLTLKQREKLQTKKPRK